MLVRPAQVIVSGATPATANLAFAGQTVERIRLDAASCAKPDELARTFQKLGGLLADTTTVALSNPLASAVLLKNITTVSGTLLVNHYLGRAYTGWIVSRLRGNAVIYEAAVQSSPNIQIALQASAADIPFDLMVF